MCGRKRIIVVTRSAPSLRLAKKREEEQATAAPSKNAGASLSVQHFRHSRRRFPDIFAWRMLLAPPFAPKITTAIYKKYIKEYYLIFRLLFIIISVEISRGRTTLPKLFLSTLKKQSLCAVLSRSCSTSNEQRAPRVQSIRLWAAARSTARFLSSVPKSTFRNNWGRLKAAEPKARASSRNASTVIRTISAFRSANIIGRFAITMPTSRPKKVKNAWLGMGERYRGLLRRFSNMTRMIFSNVSA